MINMIYTIGHTKSYLQGFKEHKNNPEKFRKLGRKDNFEGKYYPGGSVFKTYDDANKYLTEHNKK